MITVYPLEWIDSLILQTLNPKKTNISDLSKNDLALITNNLVKESQMIQIQLKNEIFALQKKRKIRLLVRKYHSILVYLLDNAIDYQENKVFQAGIFSGVIDSVVGTLNDLLSFVENRYSNYLSLYERVPIPYLLVCRREMYLKLEQLKNKKRNNVADDKVMKIVITGLSCSLENKKGEVTYKEILYQKELLKQVEALQFVEGKNNFYSALDELLIELNFNYQYYINHFVEQIEIRLNLHQTLTERIGKLLLCYKEFRQIQLSKKIIFDANKRNISYVLENWFKLEIAYLERKMELETNVDNECRFNQNSDAMDNKVECILSIDQMGLILRAGDEARILKAKSVNQVFRTIVPYLSTSRKKNLSYDSMRSKSYAAEEKDKEIAVQALERIIKHIKGF